MYLHIDAVFLSVARGEPPWSHQLFHLCFISTLDFVHSSLPSGITCGVAPSLSWHHHFSFHWIVLSTPYKYAVVKKKKNPFNPHPSPATSISLLFLQQKSWKSYLCLLSPHLPPLHLFAPPSFFIFTPIRFSPPPVHETCPRQIHQLPSHVKSKV